MSTAPDLQDRLQPALLDRLVDDAPLVETESEESRVISKAQLRNAVLRDLAWLFNAIQPHANWEQQHPQLAGTVLNFGLPALAGQQVSRLDVNQLKKTIEQTIRRFEPRILPDSLHVTAIETGSVMDTHNMIEFEIRGELWAQPVPLEILLRTKLDLEAGQVEVRDASSTALLRSAE